MQEKKPLTKCWWFWVLITIGVVMAIASPLIINCAYLSGYRSNMETNTAFSAGEILSLYGSILSFAGTVVLGAVAVYQNKMANEMNRRMTDNEQHQFIFERQPSVMLCDWDMRLVVSDTVITDKDSIYHTCKGFTNLKLGINICLVELTIINSSNIFLEMRMEKMSCTRTNEENLPFQCGGNAINPRKSVTHVAPGQIDKLRFLLDEEHFGNLGGTFCELELLLTNSIGERYIEKANFVVVMNSKTDFALHLNKYDIKPQKKLEEKKQ